MAVLFIKCTIHSIPIFGECSEKRNYFPRQVGEVPPKSSILLDFHQMRLRYQNGLTFAWKAQCCQMWHISDSCGTNCGTLDMLKQFDILRYNPNK